MGNAMQLLLVEDNPGDVLLTREALREASVETVLHHAADGVQAIAFLRKQGRHTNAPRPDLVLLDLNLPRKDGREVLEEVKNDPVLKRIPVIVLTTSTADEDVMHAYDTHVNAYIRKPVDLDKFLRVIRSIEGHWAGHVALPRQ